MDDLKVQGLLAMDLLLESATMDGYAKGFWSGDRNLADWRQLLVGHIDRWQAVNPQYIEWPSCVYGLFLLAVDDLPEFARLVGDVAGADPATYEGFCSLCSFLSVIVDDHDYTIDPRGDGVRITFDGPIGVGGVVGVSPAGLWEHLQLALASTKDNQPSAPAFR